MGANLDCRAFDINDKQEIVSKWNDEVDQSLHEDGHSYSGTIGMLGHGVKEWLDLRFADGEQAYQHISRNHQKWNGATAVSFLGKDGSVCWLVGGWCSS